MRKQEERPSHELWSFARYLNKVFAFRSASDRLTVSRHQPEISAPAVFRAVFYGLVFRLTSFQQLQSDIAQPAFQRWIGVERAFGDDVLRYSLCGFDLSALETMLVQVNRTLKRNKGLDSGRVQGRIVAALDGIEVLSSYSRCCQACLERRISYAQADGTPCERIQYYHRAVGCQIVSGPVNPYSPSNGCGQARAKILPPCAYSGVWPNSMATASLTSCCWIRFTRRLRCFA